MAVVVKNEVKYDHFFDAQTKRHQINGVQTVLHCHHFTSLYTQLAIDSNETDLIRDCARDSFRTMLDKYFADNPDIESIQDKIEIACQYYALIGLGKMKVNFLGDESGEVELLSSHTDAGWMKKWDKYDRPINYITAGYIEALFGAILGVEGGAFEAIERQSIVMGAETSLFNVVRR